MTAAAFGFAASDTPDAGTFEAIFEALEAFIAEARYYAWKHAVEVAGGDEDAASQVVAYFAQWHVVARRVPRPTVEIVPRAQVIDAVRDVVVG